MLDDLLTCLKCRNTQVGISIETENMCVTEEVEFSSRFLADCNWFCNRAERFNDEETWETLFFWTRHFLPSEVDFGQVNRKWLYLCQPPSGSAHRGYNGTFCCKDQKFKWEGYWSPFCCKDFCKELQIGMKPAWIVRLILSKGLLEPWSSQKKVIEKICMRSFASHCMTL